MTNGSIIKDEVDEWKQRFLQREEEEEEEDNKNK